MIFLYKRSTTVQCAYIICAHKIFHFHQELLCSLFAGERNETFFFYIFNNLWL